MQSRREDRGDVTVVFLAGSVGAGDHAEFRKMLHDLLGEGRARLAVEASDLEYVNSSAIAALVEFYEQAVRSGGGLAIVRPNTAVAKVLRSVGLSEIVHVCTSVGGAVRRLGGKKPG